MQLNGLANTVQILQQAKGFKHSFEKDLQIDKALKNLLLYCQYARECQQNPNLTWIDFKSRGVK